MTWDGIVVDARTPAGELRDLRIGLLGEHQASNAAVVLALLEALVEQHGIGVGETQIRQGLASARWPGRLELLDGGALGVRRILLDGAHNPAGAQALAVALRSLGLRRPVIVFGAMRGKRVADVLRALAPLDPRFVFTRVDDPQAHEPDELARTWRRVGGRRALSDPDPRSAVARIDGDPIVVAGSLYLVGAVRGMIARDTEET